MKKYLLTSLFFLIFSPFFVWGADTVVGVIDEIKTILKAIVPLIGSLAIIYFLWSTAQYILKEGDAKNEARTHMIWGIIILFVMISVWGLVAILTNTFLE